MVRFGSAVPLLAAAYLAVAAAHVIPGAFIFEFEDDQDKVAALDSVKKNGDVRMNLDFELFSGVSVQLHDVENSDMVVNKLAALPAVKSVWPVSLHKIPEPEIHWTGNPSGNHDLVSRDDPTTDVFSPHVMTQIDKLRAKGYTGKGVHLAVIDTGIDYGHPGLGACYGTGCLITNGYDLVGDAFDGVNNTIPVPDDDPMDCAGHGTHVAGIVAATDSKLGFTGGAPGVTLGAYRVFGCNGSTTSDVLIAAMNRAYIDGANIITMSIGGPNGWKENAWAVAASRIADKGVIVAISAGNDGKQGIFFASSGSSGENVAAIAAYQNVLTPTLVYYGNATVQGKDKKEFSYVLGKPNVFDTTLPLWAATLNTTAAADLCSPLPGLTTNLSSVVVLVRRGGCTFDQKVNNAAAKGAKFFMFYNNVDAPPTLLNLESSAPETVKGVGFTDKKTGEAWIEQLRAGKKISLTLGSNLDTKLTVKNIDNAATGGGLSNFTSWGPTWTMDVKPQFGAPGGQILSTFPRAKGCYAVLSGTSMACPLTASIYALLVEVRGTQNPALLRNLLSANSNPQVFNDGARFHDALAPVPQQGGGMVQAYDAAFATTLLEPSSLSFNETTYFAKSRNFTLTNEGKGDVTYDIFHVPALTVMTLKKGANSVSPFPGEFVTDSATIKFSENKVTLKKGDKVTVEVLATPPAIDGARLPVWSGYVRVNGTDGTSLSLPYQGLVGSLHDHVVLQKNATWIAKAGDTELTPVAPNTVFTLPRPGSPKGKLILPTVASYPVLGSPLFQYHVVPVSANGAREKPLGQMSSSPSQYAARGKDSLDWDGKLEDKTYAPAGTYKIVVKALRLYGNKTDKKDWDESITPPFIIKYA
ncbi:subtilisin-like protease [Epichloe bromicola]|uniref:Subtilisin-like protease n=1 Tax=Epichloe bromicola TaxID=79588 RepID=A0ABQ0CL18_9HYPO